MRRRATKQQIALTIGLLTVLIAAGYWWSPHIWWAWLIARNSAKVPSIPVSALQAPGKTTGWYRFRIGPLSFKLPPEMAEEAERSVGKDRDTISLTSPTGELLIFVPYKLPEGAQTEVAQVAAYLHLSPMQCIADGYRASTDDFRWTMSRAELTHHQVLLNLGRWYPHLPGTKVESLFDGPLEGLLTMYDKSHAMFEWQSKSGAAGGFVKFGAKAGDLKLDQVRDICASVTCDESKLGPEATKSELAELVDTMVITKE